MGIVEFISSANHSVFWFLHSGFNTPVLDSAFTLITFLGSTWLWLGVAVLYLVVTVFLQRDQRDAFALFLSTLFVVGSYSVLKSLFHSPRPEDVFSTIREIQSPYYLSFSKLLFDGAKTYGFPSGHSALIFSAVGLSFRSSGWVRLVVLVAAILVGVSRVYLGLHFPLDVVGGAVVGFGIGYLMQRAFRI